MTDTILHRLGLTLASTPEEVAKVFFQYTVRLHCADCYFGGVGKPCRDANRDRSCAESILEVLLHAYRQHESEAKGEAGE